MLAYQRPASRSAACAGVSVARPSMGLLMGPVQGRTTPALAPIAAGPWKWAPVAGPVRPRKLTFQRNRLVSLLSTASTEPLPLLATAGTSLAPRNWVLKASRLGWLGWRLIMPQPVMAARTSTAMAANEMRIAWRRVRMISSCKPVSGNDSLRGMVRAAIGQNRYQ